MKNYTAYLIVTKENGSESQIYRRYNEFATLRKVLQDFYPGIYIPNIPEKQALVKTKNYNNKKNK